MGRKPIPQRKRTQALVRAKGHCESCEIDLNEVSPDIHHIDGNHNNNDLSNLIVLCPNCHRKKDKEVQEKIEKEKGKRPVYKAIKEEIKF